MLGGGALALVLLGAGGTFGYTTMVSASEPTVDPTPAATHASPHTPTPTPTPTPSDTPKASESPTKIDIGDERTDPRPLGTDDAFPDKTLTMEGHTFDRIKRSLNKRCDFTARGALAKALVAQHCRKVVRATYLDTDKKIAVTTGIAVLPTDAAAKATMRAQDPDHYVWFRGMKGPGAKKIDRPGGRTASVLRGRYIIYAYAIYADDHKVKKKEKNKTLTPLAKAFRDSTRKVIDRRAHPRSFGDD